MTWGRSWVGSALLLGALTGSAAAQARDIPGPVSQPLFESYLDTVRAKKEEAEDRFLRTPAGLEFIGLARSGRFYALAQDALVEGCAWARGQQWFRAEQTYRLGDGLECFKACHERIVGLLAALKAARESGADAEAVRPLVTQLHEFTYRECIPNFAELAREARRARPAADERPTGAVRGATAPLEGPPPAAPDPALAEPAERAAEPAPAPAATEGRPTAADLEAVELPDRRVRITFDELLDAGDRDFYTRRPYAFRALALVSDAGGGAYDDFLRRLLAGGARVDVRVAPDDDMRGTEGVYRPGDRAIVVPARRQRADGTFVRGKSSFVATLVHELWHAYYHQVVQAGGDPELRAVMEETKGWLRRQTVRHRNDPGVTPRPVSEVVDDLDDFADEYVGALINDLVSVDAGIRGRLAVDRSIAARERAKATWAQLWDAARGRYASSYENRREFPWLWTTRKDYTVQAAPPERLLETLRDRLGLGRF